MTRASRPVWIAAVLLTAAAAFASDSLRSPWDNLVTASDSAFSCSDVPALPHDFTTNSYLIDPQHSITDPLLLQEHKESVAGLQNFSRAVVKAADAFQAKGSRSAAECVISLLESAASQRALTGKMDGHQAVYEQGSNLGAWAVAFLKVRNSGVASDEQNKKITGWLRKLANANRAYYDARSRRPGPNDAYGHHRYWAGFAIAAVAVANNDREMFGWSMAAYQQGISEIQADGTLPLDMDRGQLALHSHLYSLAPLVMLAEFGEVNGMDLYAERNFAIGRLIAVCVTGLEDPSFFQEKTGVAQAMPAEMEAWEISWAKPYTHRFPNPKISVLLAKASHLNYTVLGGLPPA